MRKDNQLTDRVQNTAKDVTYKDVIIEAISNNATSPPKNSDFFNSLNVDGVTVERVWVNIGDDCFSPKSNTSNVHVNTMVCLFSLLEISDFRQRGEKISVN